MERTAVSVIVPAMNEARNLPYVLPLIPRWVHEVILVDGGSTDGTPEVARALLARHPHRRPAAARARAPRCSAGFAAATGDIIVMLDADGSTDPAEIPLFVGASSPAPTSSRARASSRAAGPTTWRRCGEPATRCFACSVRLAFGGHYTDLCYGYNAFWRRILPALEGDGDGFEIETMMNVRALAAGLRVAEVPSLEAARIHGESNLRTFRDGARVLSVIVRERLLLGAPATVAARPPRPALGVGAPQPEAPAHAH